VSGVVVYGTQSGTYKFIPESVCPPTPPLYNIPLPPVQSPSPVIFTSPIIGPVLRSPLRLLADTAINVGPLATPTVPSSPVTPLSYVTSDSDVPQTPVSPIDYNRVADGLHPVEDWVFPSTAPSPRPLPPLPNDAALDNQENRIPLPDFSDPRCTTDVVNHPHQYVAVTTPRRPEWRPEDELILDHAIHLPTAEELVNNPPQFPTVTPFRHAALHTQRIHPCSQPLTHVCFIPPIAVCSKAARTPICRNFPLGYITYNFSASILDTFGRYTPEVQGAFANSLVILEITDLLDGRHITTYGYLKFEGTRIYVTDQTYHCEDFVRTFPQLLEYTFTPRIPADPFPYLRVHPDDLALSTA
jgi:hypothetical protein